MANDNHMSASEPVQLTPIAGGLGLRHCHDGRVIWSFTWDELVEIVAFKRDMFTVDDICLGFRVKGKSDFFVCDEEMAGWQELQETLAHRFGLNHCQWVARIMFPPFVENWTVLWARSGAI